MKAAREARALEQAWHWFCEMDGDIPFSEIVMRVRAQCPEVDPARVRADFVRRLTTRKGGAYVGRTDQAAN